MSGSGSRNGLIRQGRGELFHGWYIVAVCFVVNFIVFGISVNTFTVYLKPIEAEMGWLRGEISLAIMVGAFSMGLAASFIGRLIDRVGARVVMAAGATVVGVSSMLLARTQSLPYFYAIFAVSGVGQAAATLIPISLVISNWFKAKRGKALGIAMTGTGLGAMVMVPVTSWVVVNWDWRTSFLVMGCVILLTAPMTLLLIRTRPSDMGLLPDGGGAIDGEPVSLAGLSVPEALRSGAFWLIGSMMLLAGLIAMGIGVHLMPYLTDIGHPAATASLIISIISGLTVVGKIGLGFVVDRWGLQRTLVLTYGVIAVGILLLTGAKALAVACVFAVVYGFAIGAPLLINPALTAECMGLANFGAIFGVLTLLNTVGVAIGAVLTGVIYDNVESYFPAFVLFVVLAAVAGSCGVLARRLRPIEGASSKLA
jgi:MFS family permease